MRGTKRLTSKDFSHISSVFVLPPLRRLFDLSITMAIFTSVFETSPGAFRLSFFMPRTVRIVYGALLLPHVYYKRRNRSLNESIVLSINAKKNI